MDAQLVWNAMMAEWLLGYFSAATPARTHAGMSAGPARIVLRLRSARTASTGRNAIGHLADRRSAIVSPAVGIARRYLHTALPVLYDTTVRSVACHRVGAERACRRAAGAGRGERSTDEGTDCIVIRVRISMYSLINNVD